MMIDVVGAENSAGELLEEVGLFVGDAVRADDADGLATARVTAFAEFLTDIIERNLPAYWFELAVGLADHRLGDAGFVVGEVEGIAALVAEEVAVDAGLVPVVAAYDLAAVGGAADSERSFAAVAAVGADGADVVHLPRAGFVPVG